MGEGETPRVETYPIGIGREGYNTPLGVTKTTMRLEDPAWYPPSSIREEAEEATDLELYDALGLKGGLYGVVEGRS